MTEELANAHDLKNVSSGTKHSEWVLFGATGVTGRLVLERALARGHRPRLAGRPSAAFEALGRMHGLATTPLQLNDMGSVHRAIAGCRLVLNAAGPFSLTAPPVIEAAIAGTCDYLDLNGELAGLRQLLARDAQARTAGVALVGGCGFGVAASDGPALMVSERLGGAERLRISVAADSAFASPAVAESTLGVLAGGGFEVEAGQIARCRIAAKRWAAALDPAAGAQQFASAPLADLAAALHATGVPHIEAGVPMVAAQARVLSVIAPLLPALLKLGPVRAAMASTGGHGGSADEAEASARRSRVLVEGWRGDRSASALLEAGEGFAVAADIAVAAVEAALARRPEPGAHTPATAFGPGFIGSVPGVNIRER